MGIGPIWGFNSLTPIQTLLRDFPIIASSLQRPLSSVPKVAVVERFNCMSTQTASTLATPRRL